MMAVALMVAALTWEKTLLVGGRVYHQDTTHEPKAPTGRLLVLSGSLDFIVLLDLLACFCVEIVRLY